MTARKSVFVLVMSLIITACGQHVPSATSVPTTTLVSVTPIPTQVLVPTETPTLVPNCRGYQIAFVQAGTYANIWVMCEDGTGQRQLTADSETWGYDTPQWSSDGQQIFFRSVSSEGTRFEVMNADGTGRRAISRYYTFSPNDSYLGVAATLLPDGEHIIYTAPEGGVYLVELDGGEERLIAEGGFREVISPDGTRLLFARWGQDPPLAAFYVVNVDGTGERQISPAMALFGGAFWSPDGQLIAFTALENDIPALHVMSADGNSMRRLVYGLDIGPYHLSWSWDSRWIAFSSGMTRPVIYLVDAGGLYDPRFLALGRNPEWSPNDWTLVYQNWNPDLSAWAFYSIEAWPESDPVLLTNTPSFSAWEPTWSPLPTTE